MIFAAALAFSSPQAAAIAVTGHTPSESVISVNVSGDYATVRVMGGIMEGSPVTFPILVKHFSFGWQPLASIYYLCDLTSFRLGDTRNAALLQGMPQPKIGQGVCRWQFDNGPKPDVEAVRLLMRGPLVPYVTVSRNWALGSWYGAGGGQTLFEKKRGRWQLVKGWGGAISIPELKNNFGVPVDIGCDLARDDRYC